VFDGWCDCWCDCWCGCWCGGWCDGWCGGDCLVTGGREGLIFFWLNVLLGLECWYFIWVLQGSIFCLFWLIKRLTGNCLDIIDIPILISSYLPFEDFLGDLVVLEEVLFK
jgi:hypothetical protein